MQNLSAGGLTCRRGMRGAHILCPFVIEAAVSFLSTSRLGYLKITRGTFADMSMDARIDKHRER